MALYLNAGILGQCRSVVGILWIKKQSSSHCNSKSSLLSDLMWLSIKYYKYLWHTQQANFISRLYWSYETYVLYNVCVHRPGILHGVIMVIPWKGIFSNFRAGKKDWDPLVNGQASLSFPCPTFNSTCPLGELERTERTSMLYQLSRKMCTGIMS